MAMTGLSIQEIRGLHKELGKAMADEANKDILALLTKLKEGVVPTEDLIRTTKIGQIVGKLRAYSKPEIAAQAKALVQGWKAIIDKERTHKCSNGSGATTSSTTVDKGSGTTGTSKEGSDGPRTQSATPTASSPQGVNSPTKSTAFLSTPAAAESAPGTAASIGKAPDFTILREKTRNVCLKLIFDALKLAEVKEVSDSQIFSIALDVEESVYDKLCSAGKTVNQEYRGKMRSLSLNLKDKSNPQFRRRVVEGELSAKKLVDLTAAEMASEERLAENRSLEQQNMLVAQSAAEQTAETDAFQCARCKQRKCRYYQKQTRSADEPMTTFVTCTVCGNRWKFC